MAFDFPVYQFNESLRGAPQLSGTAGALISVLDACLITGFGTTSVSSLVVADGVATATVNAGNSFEPHHIVLIEGAAPSTLNGRHRVTGSTATTFTFATTVANGSATGTITAKYAPAEGWEKVFDDGGQGKKAVYRATTGNRMYYRINDDFTQKYVAEIRGYESMTDIDSGNAPFPLNRTSTLEKSNENSASARYWDLFADSQCIMFGAQQWRSPGTKHYSTPCRMFGDPIALSPSGDPWCSMVLSSPSVSSNQNATSGGAPFYSYRTDSTTDSGSFARPLSGVGSPIYNNCVAQMGGDRALSGKDETLGPAPSAVNGQLYLSPVYLCEGSNGPSRAIVPGVWYVPQTGLYALFSVRSALIPESGPLAGRRLIAFSCHPGTSSNSDSSSSSSGRYFIDSTGPWRD